MTITENKIAEARKELKEWLEKANRKQEDYSKNIQKIQEELDLEKIRKSIRLPFEYLDNWYSSNFVYEALTIGRDAISKTNTVTNEYNTIVLTDKLAEQYPNNPPFLLFDKVVYWLANSFSQKRYKESEVIFGKINKWLDSEVLKGGLDSKPSFWFILDVAKKCFSANIDYNAFNYPSNMVVYDEALNNWNTTDLILLDNIVTKLCEFHLENATYDSQEDAEIQFGKDVWFVYVFEILSWLSAREKIGLINPVNFTHPFMNLELNKLLVQENITLNNEISDLFEKVMQRLF